MSSTSADEKFDPRRRRLCPDGACVGLLDESGRCKECGLTASGEPGADVIPLYDESPEAADSGDEATGTDAVAAEDEAPAPGESAFDPRRRLCPDGNCVGVIGSDNRCKVCGQAAG